MALIAQLGDDVAVARFLAAGVVREDGVRYDGYTHRPQAGTSICGRLEMELPWARPDGLVAIGAECSRAVGADRRGGPLSPAGVLPWPYRR